MNTETETTFTKDQLADFILYEEVRLTGAYNMFDPRARRSTGLSSHEYSFVMQNYEGLSRAWKKLNGEA